MNIFLSAPFTQLLADTGVARTEFREVWSQVYETLRSAGHTVASAHEREDWGQRLDTPADALAADLDGLRAADLVIAYVGSPPSPGVQLEIGYSLALDRALLLFADRGVPEPYLLRGVPA